MELKELITAIAEKHKEQGIIINPPAANNDILVLEKKVGFALPLDFKAFYSYCNGFACDEDAFNMTPLSEIYSPKHDYGNGWFYFAEYMTCSDKWGLRNTWDNRSELFCATSTEIVIGTSLNEFLKRFLAGNVFDDGGLCDWMIELGIYNK